MTQLDEQLKETTQHIESTLQSVENGNTLSDEAAHELTRLIQQAEELRAKSIRNDSVDYTMRQLVTKYSLPIETLHQVINIDEEKPAAVVFKSSERLLELAPLAITDVRGERILKTMHQKISTGARPGITVMGPHVTIRFNGTENNMQSVTMQVVSIVDTAVEDESED